MPNSILESQDGHIPVASSPPKHKKKNKKSSSYSNLVKPNMKSNIELDKSILFVWINFYSLYSDNCFGLNIL